MFEKIFVSPSNQTGNTYAYGNTNEAVVCGEIAKYTEAALKRCNFQTKTMQWETAQERCKQSNAWGADLHLPIHTNAFDCKVAGTRTIVYALKGASYEAAKVIHKELAAITPGTSENISANTGLIELNQPKALAVYLEVDFHDVKDVGKWLIENTELIGETICKGVCKYYGRKYVEPGADEKSEEKEADEFVEATEMPEHYDTAKAGIYKVKQCDGLFFRTGPDTKYKAMEMFAPGTVLRCLGHYTGVWLRVETVDNRVGFCHSDYLTKS